MKTPTQDQLCRCPENVCILHPTLRTCSLRNEPMHGSYVTAHLSYGDEWPRREVVEGEIVGRHSVRVTNLRREGDSLVGDYEDTWSNEGAYMRPSQMKQALTPTGRIQPPLELQNIPSPEPMSRHRHRVTPEDVAFITRHIDTKDIEQRLLNTYAGGFVGFCFEEKDLRQGCACQCCDHSEGSDCACDCHAEGLCAAHIILTDKDDDKK